MARLLIGAALGVAIGVVVGAALDIHADDDLVALAAEANVDAQDLEAAVATVADTRGAAVDPRTYLIHAGHLAPPYAPSPPSVPAWSVWDSLAACESTSRWHVATGNGYWGGLQMDMTFWRRHGGLAYAARPDLASREAQIAVAIRGLAVQGWGAWPACSRRLGLR